MGAVEVHITARHTDMHAELPTDLKMPNEAYAWRHVIYILGSVYALLFISYLICAKTEHPWIVALFVPFLGAQIYKITIIMHDCCHYTLFRRRAVNARVGTICGWFVGADFKNFSRLHWKHHARYGEKDDPQGADYLYLEGASRWHILWHIVRPIFGYNLFKLFQFGKAAADHPTQQPHSKKSSWANALSFLAGVGAIQISLAATATGLFEIWWLVLLYPVSAGTFALFFSQTRGFAEHVADPGQSPIHHARTHVPNLFDRLFFYTLNFNYHIEHHQHPSIPSCHLPRIHQEMRARADYGEVSNGILQTVMRRWGYRRGEQ